MKIRLLNLWDDFRESFWFAPAMLSLLAVPLAFAALYADHRITAADVQVTQFVRDAAASRQILSSVSGVVITLAGVVFSVTLVAISMASSQFGSRLLRCYMTDSVADRVIGLLLATSLFCSIVLQQVREATAEFEAFVPQISTAAAALLGFISVAFLIYFVHDTALSIQAPRLIAAVAMDLDDAVERLIPNISSQQAAASRRGIKSVDLDWRRLGSFAVTAPRDGYVEGIDVETLVQAAQRTSTIIEVICRPGHFASTTSPLMSISIQNVADEGQWREPLIADIHSAVVIGSRRTPRQDISCSIIELVEVATRALSPGINNPFAAMNCIDRLGATLARIVSREFPPDHHFDSDGRLRCVMPGVSFSNLLSDAFAQIRQYGCTSVAVSIRLIETLVRIREQAHREEDISAIRRQAEAIRTAFLDSKPAAVDVDDFNRRYEHFESLEAI
ncbi:MAG: DUF2254 domain-containing protein [Planctomycetaceae bacterium]